MNRKRATRKGLLLPLIAGFCWLPSPSWGQEIVTIDSAGDTGRWTATTQLNNRLAVAYYDATNGNVKLWHDDGAGGGTAADGLANGTEIRTIDAAVGSDLGIFVHNGFLAVSYGGANGGTAALRVWYDDGGGAGGGGTAGDGQVDGSEIRTIDAGADVGYDSAITAWNGNLTVSYADRTNNDLKLWVDDGGGTGGTGTAGDFMANGNEIRVIDAPGNVGRNSSITVWNGQLVVAYYDNPSGNLQNGSIKIWIDDGSGTGTAGNGQADGTEIRFVAAPSGLGRNAIGGQLNGLAVWNNAITVSFY